MNRNHTITIQPKSFMPHAVRAASTKALAACPPTHQWRAAYRLSCDKRSLIRSVVGVKGGFDLI